MRSLFYSTVLAALAVTQVAAQWDQQSAPFHLQVVSANETLNGSGFVSCHEGAAIEGLCLSVAPGDTYYFNTSSTGGDEGYLVWNLQTSSITVSSPLKFYYSLSSNVALPLFQTTYGDLLTFTDDDFLAVPSFSDDTVTPPVSTSETALQRWVVCTTYFSGYTYTSLAWVLGEAPAQNPSCQSVQVKRVY